jgi:hypothetical protein
MVAKCRRTYLGTEIRNGSAKLGLEFASLFWVCVDVGYLFCGRGFRHSGT